MGIRYPLITLWGNSQYWRRLKYKIDSTYFCEATREFWATHGQYLVRRSWQRVTTTWFFRCKLDSFETQTWFFRCKLELSDTKTWFFRCKLEFHRTPTTENGIRQKTNLISQHGRCLSGSTETIVTILPTILIISFPVSFISLVQARHVSPKSGRRQKTIGGTTSFPGSFISPPQRERGKKDPGSGWSHVLGANLSSREGSQFIKVLSPTPFVTS